MSIFRLGDGSDASRTHVTTFLDVPAWLDIVVAADDGGAPPSKRTVRAIGESKAGETIGMGHLQRLEKARAAFATRAAHAKLLLCGPSFNAQLETTARTRSDVELVGLDRLHGGS